MTEEVKVETLELVDFRTPIKVDDVAKSMRDAILEGHVDEAKAGIYLKKMAKVAETLLKDEEVKKAILTKTETYLEGKKTNTFFGATVTKQAVYTYYDYDDCNHPELEALMEIKKQVEKRITEIQEELILLIPKDENKIITPNNGESNFDMLPTRTKSVVIETIPELVHTPSGEIAEVKAPIKKQTIGLKYTKL